VELFKLDFRCLRGPFSCTASTPDSYIIVHNTDRDNIATDFGIESSMNKQSKGGGSLVQPPARDQADQARTKDPLELYLPL
jgi:hypothetical protein